MVPVNAPLATMIVASPFGFRRVPEWRRTLVFNTDDPTEIYYPCSHPMFVCASFQGVTILHDGCGHFFVPLPWVERTYPEHHEEAQSARVLVAQSARLHPRRH